MRDWQRQCFDTRVGRLGNISFQRESGDASIDCCCTKRYRRLRSESSLSLIVNIRRSTRNFEAFNANCNADSHAFRIVWDAQLRTLIRRIRARGNPRDFVMSHCVRRELKKTTLIDSQSVEVETSATKDRIPWEIGQSSLAGKSLGGFLTTHRDPMEGIE
ncbi:unnamed protein product [Albugo candida]|uniref:Uncharacterized protein n=1 Tax=Albugo candida TaxID=65357 RepID=A0A024FWI9_9STRA|nr:unnamed protein product [Albugo candida]|eukprot:CCI11411.1 unnamed protein product [Albugo candida]